MMSDFRIILALILPLCQAFPFGYYMTADHEPPSLEKCPGTEDGFYQHPEKCHLYVECRYMWTETMKTNWVMPCIPGSRFQYPSVCELPCEKKSKETNRQVDDQDKSSTTTPHAATPSTRPQTTEGKEQMTQKSTVAEQTTLHAMDTSTMTEGRERTTAGHSPEEQEGSTHTLDQTSGHQVSNNEETTKSPQGDTATSGNDNIDLEGTTAISEKATLNIHVDTQSTQSIEGDAETTATTSTTTTTTTSTIAAAAAIDDATTHGSAKETEQETEGTTAQDVNTTPESAKDSESQSNANTTPQSHDVVTLNAIVNNEAATVAKITAHENPEGTTASNIRDQSSPAARATFVAFSDSTDGQNVNTNDDETKEVDSSKANEIEVTVNIMKSALLNDSSDLSEQHTTSADMDLFTTSVPSTQNLADSEQS